MLILKNRAAAVLALAAVTGCLAGGCSAGDINGRKGAPLVLYVVRHGQTILNLMDRVQGICDGVLTQKGIEGAVNMGKGLREINFSAVYSSDLARAYDTARLAMEQNTATKDWEVERLKDLREVSFGVFEGDPNYVMYRAFADDLGLFVPAGAKDIGSATKPILAHFGGDFMLFLEQLADFNKRVDVEYNISEDSAGVYERLRSGVDAILSGNPDGGNVMLVAHGQSINFLFKALGVDTAGAPLANSSVTKIKYEDGVFVLDGPVGDMSYMENGAGL